MSMLKIHMRAMKVYARANPLLALVKIRLPHSLMPLRLDEDYSKQVQRVRTKVSPLVRPVRPQEV
jgi:hypothetical protein